MKPMQQIPFDLVARPALGRDDFLVGNCNRAAVALIDKWPGWSAPLLVIQGPAASGKSHLAAVWRDLATAHIVRPDMLATHSAADIAALGHHIVLDGLDLWLGDSAAETTLFHLYNMFREEGRSLLVTMRMTPQHMDYKIADLASRMRAAPRVSIREPDDSLLASILVKLFTDRQLTIGEDVIHYILPRMERSFRSAQEIVEKADHAALAQKKAVTLATIRTVLAQLQDC